MSILVPVYSKGITLTEIPNRVAVFFELGNCTQNCDECHSPHLQHRHNETYLTYLKDLEKYADEQIELGANAIVILGGTTTKDFSYSDLVKTINALAQIAPVCVYSGSDDDKMHNNLFHDSGLTWLKTGSYQKYKGGLDKETTNQRFYKKEISWIQDKEGHVVELWPIMHDMTELFQQR